MRRAVLLLAAALLLTTFARAAALPMLPDGALPEALMESAEKHGVLDGGLVWLIDTARAAAAGMVRESARGAALLVLAAILCGAAEGAASGAGGADYVPFCGVLAASMLAAGDLKTLIGLGARTVEELSALAKLLLPTFSAALAAGGFVTTASAWQMATLLICDALSGAVSRFLLPLVYCYLAASAAGAMLGEERLDALADGLKALTKGGLKLLAAAFTAYLAVSGVLTGSADRAAVKAAKAALGGAVPVVGGVLADAAEGVLAAAGTLRGTVGALGMFAVLAACLVPLLRLGAQLLLYKLAAFAAGLVGTKALAGFLDALGETFALVFAMTATSALLLLAALLVAITMTAG